jgi:signal peptidase I
MYMSEELLFYTSRSLIYVCWLVIIFLIVKIISKRDTRTKHALLVPVLFLGVSLIYAVSYYQYPSFILAAPALGAALFVGMVMIFFFAHKETIIKAIFKSIFTIIIAIIAFYALASAGEMIMGHSYVIKGNAMAPQYNNGDYVRVGLPAEGIQRNDVVLVRKDGEVNIYRVLAVPGDSLHVADEMLYINNDPDLTYPLRNEFEEVNISSEPMIIPEDKYYIKNDASKVDIKILLVESESILGVVKDQQN